MLGSGTRVNIEVQRSDQDDHLRRVRFNVSSITVKESNTGEKFENVLDLYVVYISEKDIFKGNRTIYHVEKILRETGEPVEDGLHEIFVNTAVFDGTDIAELMSCFLKKEVNHPKFPRLSNEVNRIKHTEGGVDVMCEVMQRYETIAKEEGRREGRVEGRLQLIASMLMSGKTAQEIAIFTGISPDEIEEAKQTILVNI